MGEDNSVENSQRDLSIRDFVRQTSPEEMTSIEGTVGKEAINSLLSRGLTIKKEDTKTVEGSATFVVPFDNRIISIVHTPQLGMVDISFELEEDYLSRKTGRFTKDESFATSGEKIQPGTVKFLRFMKEFVTKISDDCRVRLVADERRTKVYKRFLEQIDKPNVHLAPKTFSISAEDL